VESGTLTGRVAFTYLLAVWIGVSFELGTISRDIEMLLIQKLP
jgi:hypothetical protein